MITLRLVLGIIDKILDLELERVKHMTDEQAEVYWPKVEARLAPFERIADKLSAVLNFNAVT